MRLETVVEAAKEALTIPSVCLIAPNVTSYIQNNHLLDLRDDAIAFGTGVLTYLVIKAGLTITNYLNDRQLI